jgi:DNA polymerase III epsilon subunit-like protein
MNYVVFDLEFNQDFSSLDEYAPSLTRYPFEIIQIGASKLNSNLKTIQSFDRFIKPSLYHKINPAITDLTGITTKQLQNEQPFPSVYQDFLEFIGNADTIFCTWGKTDLRELYSNASFHHLDVSLLPTQYINLQPLVSLHFHQPATKLMKLQTAVETLNIPITIPFHNALNDAFYTAKIWKKLYHPAIQPQFYNPNITVIKTRQPKKELNFAKLLLQFEKMYQRSMSEEEETMIKLAYHMGKTGQFMEVVTPIEKG